MLTVIVAGRLTKDSVLRYTADGTPVAGFTVATDVGFGDKRHGVFIGCSLWGKRAEALDPYLKKGTSVTVVGEGDLRKWETQQSSGAEISCKVTEVALQGAKGGGSPAQDRPSDQGFRRNPAPAGTTGSAQANQPVTGADFADDDIPF